MARRRRAEVRPIQPDLVYQDVLVSAMINRIMEDGKKNLASRIFYGAMKLVQERTGQESLKIFKQAFDNVKPRVEVRSRRVGGSTYQVPVEVSARRQQSLTLRWMMSAVEGRPERTAIERLAGEIMDAAQGRGGAIKKKTTWSVWRKPTALTRTTAGNPRRRGAGPENRAEREGIESGTRVTERQAAHFRLLRSGAGPAEAGILRHAPTRTAAFFGRLSRFAENQRLTLR